MEVGKTYVHYLNDIGTQCKVEAILSNGDAAVTWSYQNSDKVGSSTLPISNFKYFNLVKEKVKVPTIWYVPLDRISKKPFGRVQTATGPEIVNYVKNCIKSGQGYKILEEEEIEVEI